MIWMEFVWAVLGLAGLYFGAEWLVNGSASLAFRLGITPLVVGLTIVAFGTSSPELLVCLQANHVDKGSLAVGNIIGSNICNIALILGVSAILRPLSIKSQLVRREAPILLGATVVFLFILKDNTIARWEGGLLFAGIVAYLLTGFKKKGGEKKTEFPQDAMGEGTEPAAVAPGIPQKQQSLFVSISLVVCGLALLMVGSKLLVTSGSVIARAFNVSEAVIGLTLIAIGTSLPELATSIIATIRRQGDIITGNAIGSCIFNLLAVMGITAMFKAVAFTGIDLSDLIFMTALTTLLVPFLWTRRSLGRVEGAVFLLIYAVYCYTLIGR